MEVLIVILCGKISSCFDVENSKCEFQITENTVTDFCGYFSWIILDILLTQFITASRKPSTLQVMSFLFIYERKKKRILVFSHPNIFLNKALNKYHLN